jgi:L,D-transpeptidase catalytic domain
MLPQKLVYASLFATGLTLAFASAAFAGVDISVDKTTQHMTVSIDGVTRYVFPVSTGRPGYDTPSGVFHPRWMSVLHYSKLYEDAPMPHSIFFTSGYAIHGFTDTPFGAAAVSHGCVRLPPGDAALLFRLVKQDGMANTTIVIHGHIPRGGLVARRNEAMREAEDEQPALVAYGFAERRYGRPSTHGRVAYGDGWTGLPHRPPPFLYDGGAGTYGAGAYD